MKNSRQPRQGILAVTIVVVLAMLALSVSSLVRFQQLTKSILFDKTQSDMQRYTSQSCLLLQTTINNYFRQLDYISLFCSANTGVNDNEITQLIREKNGESDDRMIGLADLNGTLYTGSGKSYNISSRDYFQKAIHGEPVISNVETINGKDFIILGRSIEKNGKITGAAFARYSVHTFTELFADSQFAGHGATLIMQKSGKMVSSYAGMENFNTFYEALTPMQFTGGQSIESFRNSVEQNESGFVTYVRNGRERYMYFAPAGINDWMVISLAMSETLNQQTDAINNHSAAMLGLNILFYTVIFLCILLFYFSSKRAIQDGQRDALTGLYNKEGMKNAVSHFLKQEGRKKHHAFLFIDIDDFKQINDTQGHDEGDRLLIQFSEFLRGNFRESDIIGRFGGDEFIILIKDLPSLNAVSRLADELIARTAKREDLPASISIGISCYPNDALGYEKLLQLADQALYQAKASGKNQSCLYNPPGF